jgi:hypothetical protein
MGPSEYRMIWSFWVPQPYFGRSLNYTYFDIDYFLGFSSKNKPLCSFNYKISCNLVISCDVPIHFMFMKVFGLNLKYI